MTQPITDSKMLPSFHDDLLISYEVDCEAHRITMRFRRPEWADEKRDRVVVFDGVAGYQFSGDAFGNVVAMLESISIEQLLSEYGADIAEAYRTAGSPGPDLTSAPQSLTADGIKGFRLESSFGLSGWVLARDVTVSFASLDPVGHKG